MPPPAAPLAPGVTEVFYPGEIENRAEATGRTAGVLLPDKTITELRAPGDSVGVTLDLADLETAAALEKAVS